MNTRIKDYLDKAFANAPNTGKAAELRDEFESAANDRYNELISRGENEDAAFSAAISGLGDIDYLISTLEENYGGIPKFTKEEWQASKKRSAALVSVSIMLYILSLVPFIILLTYGQVVTAFSTFFLFVALATGLLIYNANTRIPSPADIEVMRSKAGRGKEALGKDGSISPLEKELRQIIAMLALIVYFVVSVTTSAWHITWIIFILGTIAERIVHICLEGRKEKKNENGKNY